MTSEAPNKYSDQKLQEMWSKLLQYEQTKDVGESNRATITALKKIIDEVYSKCY